MQDQWVQVQPIRPHDCPVFDHDPREELRIRQGLEDRAPELVREVNVPDDAVVECQVKTVWGYHLNRGDTGNSGDLVHGSGSMVPGSSLLIRPHPVFAQQGGEGLVIDEDGQDPTWLLIGEFRVTESVLGRLPVSRSKQLTS